MGFSFSGRTACFSNYMLTSSSGKETNVFEKAHILGLIYELIKTGTDSNGV